MKRSIQNSENTIFEFNSRVKRQNLNETIDSNILGKDNFKERKKIKLSNLLSKLKRKIKVEYTTDGFCVLKLNRPNGKVYEIKRDSFDHEKLFDPVFFLKNFSLAFGYDFNLKIKDKPDQHIVKFFPHILLEIEVDLDSTKSNIATSELSNFRFLTCLFFGLVFNINLYNCDCHPSSFQDVVLLDAGVGKNCISGGCKQLLQKYPNFFDPDIHFDCSTSKYDNMIFTILNLTSSQDINVNIKSEQN